MQLLKQLQLTELQQEAKVGGSALHCRARHCGCNYNASVVRMSTNVAICDVHHAACSPRHCRNRRGNLTKERTRALAFACRSCSNSSARAQLRPTCRTCTRGRCCLRRTLKPTSPRRHMSSSGSCTAGTCALQEERDATIVRDRTVQLHSASTTGNEVVRLHKAAASLRSAVQRSTRVGHGLGTLGT